MRAERVFRQFASIVTALLLVGAPGVAAQAHDLPTSANGLGSDRYYVSLGDSLAAGYQRGVSHPEAGYAGPIAAALAERDQRLQLKNLACPGETTTTMVSGGRCSFTAGSQLAEARAFLSRYHSKVDLVTITIGANDVLRCVTSSTIDSECLATQSAAIAANLPTIVRTVRAAAPKARVVILNYYNPVLAAALTGPQGQELAAASTRLQQNTNAIIASVAAENGASVADISAAFDSYDTTPTTLPGVGVVPTNVARICTWTWMCQVNDIHANDIGYAVMAETVLAVVGDRVRRAA